MDMQNADYYVPEALRDRLGERLNKSLKLSGITVEEMAAYIEVHRNTVSNWLGNRGVPANTVVLRLWAEKVNLPYSWLRDGIWPAEAPEPTVPVQPRRRGRSLAAEPDPEPEPEPLPAKKAAPRKRRAGAGAS